MANFDQFFNKVLQAEGGYVNNPKDRGGETYAGVSSKYFPQDVAKLKQLSDAGQDTTPYLRDFYKREFWDKSGAESVPEEMRMAYADTAVNSGIGKAKEILNQSSTVNQFLDNRQSFVDQIVKNDSSQAEFQDGWENRINSLRSPQNLEGGQGQSTMAGGEGVGLTSMSDEELMALYNQEKPQQDFSALSDEELIAMNNGGQPSKESTISQGNDAGALKAAAYGVSGGQIPFGNRITSGIGAGIATAYDALGGSNADLSFKDYYKQSLEDTKATQEANPKATLAGNLAGVATTLPAAFSKVPQGTSALAQTGKGVNYAKELGAKVAGYSPFQGAGKLAGAGNIATRYGGRTALAAPTTGAYFAGEADTGEMADKFKQGAGVGAILSGAIPAGGVALGAGLKGGKNIAKGITARAPEVLDEALLSMKDVGRGLYKQSEQAGAVLTPSASQGISSAVNNIVKNPQTKATQGLYKNTLSAIDNLNEDLALGNAGLETLDAHRQILGNIAKDITNPNRMQEAEAAGRAIRALDNAIEQLTPESIQSNSTQAIDSLLGARKQWAQMKKFEKIAEIIKNSGNDANKLKRDIEKFASKGKNTLGWSADELKALDFAGKQTTGEGLLKMAGKFGFDLGSGRSVGNTALPVLGGLGAGVGGAGAGLAPAMAIPAVMAIPAIGTAARQGQKYLAKGKAELLLQALEQGAIKPNQAGITAQLAKQLQNNSTAPMGNVLNNAKKKAGKAVSEYIKDESGSVKLGKGNDYFKGTKVVDDAGKPLTVYHGSNEVIDEFDPNKSAQGVFWFSENKDKILKGESGAASTKYVEPYNLKAKNLAGWDEYEKLGLGQIRDLGYDGIKLDDDYVIFEPNQIKSIHNKNPTSDPRIMYGLSGLLGAGALTEQQKRDKIAKQLGGT